MQDVPLIDKLTGALWKVVRMPTPAHTIAKHIAPSQRRHVQWAEGASLRRERARYHNEDTHASKRAATRAVMLAVPPNERDMATCPLTASNPFPDFVSCTDRTDHKPPTVTDNLAFYVVQPRVIGVYEGDPDSAYADVLLKTYQQRHKDDDPGVHLFAAWVVERYTRTRTRNPKKMQKILHAQDTTRRIVHHATRLRPGSKPVSVHVRLHKTPSMQTRALIDSRNIQAVDIFCIVHKGSTDPTMTKSVSLAICRLKEIPSPPAM